MDTYFSEIRASDSRSLAEADRLLNQEGIRREERLDYITGLYDDDHNLLATGACFANTLRCLAVDSSHQGEGLLNRVVSHLIEYQAQRGNVHLFLYTDSGNAKFFLSLGFYEIARVRGMSFMENRKDGFSSFLDRVRSSRRIKEGRTAALVMNCNPFTLGHRHLVEYTSRENDEAHLFVVSEDASFFSSDGRFAMVKAGCSDLNNVILHRTESYMISSAVFPGYFFNDGESAIEAQTRLDLVLFGKIAAALGVTRRYVGEEPLSQVTRLYNEAMMRELPGLGIECVVIPRREHGGQPISASRVRSLIRDGDLEAVRSLVPPSTFDYLMSDAGRKTMELIRSADSVLKFRASF